MSNEEQMRVEFEATGMFNVNPTFREVAWEGYQAATASKQREIDALNQQVLELSAQVADAKQLIRDGLPLCMRCDTGAVGVHYYHDEDGDEHCCEACHTEKRNFYAYGGKVDDYVLACLATLSITPPAALEAHDNEVAAKALEEAAEALRNEKAYRLSLRTEFAGYVENMADERRSRK